LNKICSIAIISGTYKLQVIERWFHFPTSCISWNCLTLGNFRTLKIMNLASNCYFPKIITKFIADDKVVYVSVKINKTMKISQEDARYEKWNRL